MLDPEPLLLVDHEQAEILEPDVAREQPMGADDDVDVPSASPRRVSAASRSDWKRESARTVTGNCANRSENVAWCCDTSNVVGTSTPTCLPSWTALNAARTAISVLPYPTSPAITRSIGTVRSMSRLTSSMTVSWSGVSTYAKASSSSRCHGVSGPKAKPGAAWRAA